MADILKEIIKGLPEGMIADAAFEGANIILYTKNKDYFLDNKGTIREAVREFKKRIELRPDPSLCLEPEKAEKEIRKIVPEEAAIDEFIFDQPRSQVIIHAEKPGLVIGRQGSILDEIRNTTLWTPQVQRSSVIKSQITEKIRSVLYANNTYRRKFLNDIGKKDFDQFVSRQNYHVVGSKIIPRLSEDMDIEQEALGEIPDEIHWKNLLRRAAIDLYINRWVHLDSLWMRERFPVGQRVSILPLFCQNHYFSIHPLSIPSLLEERKNVPSRALLDAQFYMKLSSDPEIVIPVLASDLLSQKLIGMIPAWKGEYEVLEKVSSEMSQELIHNLTFTLQSMENLFARYGLSWVFQQYSQKNIFQNILAILLRTT